MKGVQKRIAKIDNVNNRNFTIALLFAGFVGLPALLHSIMVPQPNLSIWLHLFMVLGAMMCILLPLYYIITINARRWEKLFLQEFPEINVGALEQTIALLNKEDRSRSFSDIAKTLALSLDDDFDYENDKLMNNWVNLRVLQMYLSFLPKTE